MGKLKICVFLILILGCTIKLNAGEGCLVGGKIYYTSAGTTLLGRPLFKSGLNDYYNVYSGICIPFDYTTYYTNAIPKLGSLGLQIDCGYEGDVDIVSPVRGKVYTFDEIQCPLDDYIPLLLLVTGGLGYFCLRKKILMI